ncbi:tetratricopeptide repeat protein [Ekhidna sp.]|uniref:tetratricopeptide repeat protein n=1 Tax=Ekhidna sp. TaxID=2608089 RepID=UPI003B5027B5
MPKSSAYILTILCLCSSGLIAQDNIEELIDVIENSSDLIRKVEAMNELSYIIRNSNPDSSILLSVQAEQLARSMNYPLGEADAIMNRGIGHTSLGEYYPALQEFMVALKMYEDLNNKNSQAKILNNIGRAYNFIGDTKLALNYYEQAAKLYDELNNKARQGVLLNNIGHIHKQKKNYDLALEYLRKSLHRANSLNIIDNAFYATYNIGSTFMYLNEPDSAFKYLNFTAELAEQYRDQYVLSLTYIDLGMMHYKLDQPIKAELYFKKAYNLAKKAGLRAETREAAKNLAELYGQSQNFKEAYSYLQIYKALNDSLINIDLTRRTAFKEAEDAFKQQRMQEEIERRKIEIENEKALANAVWVRNTLLAGLVGMIIISYLLYINYSRKRKANEALQKLNRQIESQALELRKANDEIRKMNSNLEELVEQRTMEVEKKNKQLQEYLSSNSHIVRAPLARILGLVDLYEPKQSDNLTFINKNLHASAIELDNALREINDLLSGDNQNNG